MKPTSVTLGDRSATFVDDQLSEGRYSSAGDVVDAGLRLLEEREIRLAALRAALVAGETSGAATAYDFDALVDRLSSRTRKARGD